MTQLQPPCGVAVDFGGTKIEATRINKGQAQASLRIATDGNAAPEEQVAAIVALLEDLELSPHERVAVALAGRVDESGGWHALNTTTLPNISGVPVQSMLSKQLAREVIVENDATASALGEFLYGAGRGVRRFGFITVSTGVGGGIILEGRPLTSPSGLAGHIGFTTSRFAFGECGSGRMCTVESIASGRAIAALAAAAGHSDMTAEHVLQAHASRATWASEIVERSAAAIAETCANLKAVLDLERIAIGGGIGLDGTYLELVRKHLSLEPKTFRVEVSHATLGSISAHLGVLEMSRNAGVSNR